MSIWDWQNEDEKKRENASPLQGIQYKQVESAPAPSGNPGKQPSLLGTVTNVAEGRAISKGLDAGENKIGDIWKGMNSPSPINPISPDEQAVNNALQAEAPVEYGGNVWGSNLALPADASTDTVAGASEGAAGPLAGVVEYAKTVDVGKSVGSGAGATAGAVAGGSIGGPPGAMIGSIIGSQLGSTVGGK